VTPSARPPRIGVAVALILVAALAAIAPIPASAVERVYSTRIYPAIQHVLTPLANLVPIALLDVAVLLLVMWLIVRFVRAGGRKAGTRAVGVTLLKTVAVVYLVFLAVWGMNYRRLPLEQKLDFDRARVTRDRAFALASESVKRLNALHGPAHQIADTHGGSDRAVLESAFSDALRALEGTGYPRTGRPKRSLLGVYFRYAAIDGMTNPIFLEVILNPDLLVIEQPEVLAHEWAHLAGYADESEANFVAWLSCLRGNALTRYSGWLSAYSRAASVLPRDTRATLPALDDGPKRDLNAIAARYRRSSPVLRTAARNVYDSYLKANRIEEGIANYDSVLQLMLGTTLGGDWGQK
jgi:Protein of unknown function (DUF3810)